MHSSNVHNPPPFVFDHVRQHGLSSVVAGIKVEVDDIVPSSVREVNKLLCVLLPSVID